jgi:RNA polymerase sigma factor (sigma-70 family)
VATLTYMWEPVESIELSADAVTISFEVWYRGLHDSLVRALLIVSGDREMARDVAGEAFARALARWDRVGVMRSPDGWTYRVAVNVLRRRLRRAALERAFFGRQPSPSLSAPQDEVGFEVWDAVRALPRRSREAVVLRYIADLTETGVAEAMGISEGAASSLLASARRTLARQLEGFDR